MSSSSGSPEHSVELLPETLDETNSLSLELRREVAKLVVSLQGNPHLGELMGDQPPRVLKGCRKIRFDRPDWSKKPRYRLVYRNEPSDGAPATVCVLAVGARDRMIAYAKASSRLVRRMSEEGRS